MISSRLLLTAVIALPLALASLAQEPGRPVIPINLPQMGEPADSALSPAEERRIGQEIVGQLYSFRYIDEDPELSAYVSQLGWRLASAADMGSTPLNFFVIADGRINAFALPGGFIGMNRGLLIAAQSESEVAGVMGHELAHVSQRHIARTQEGTQAASLATWAAVLAAILAGSADSDVVIGALSLGQAINYQRQVNYTRAHELEADRIGIQTLAKAGYDPNGMASFFSTLEQQSRLYGTGLPEFLRTHPLNTRRVSEARARAAELPPVEVADSLDFRLMQARARVLSLGRPGEGLEYYGQLLRAGQDTPAHRYGMALSQMRSGQADLALETLAPVREAHPKNVHLMLAEGEALRLANRAGDAAAVLDQALALYPRYTPAIFARASILLDLDRPSEARQVLLSHEQALGTQIHTFKLLADAAKAQNDLAEASFQMANYLVRRGDAGGALGQLDAGLRLSGLESQERARLQAKRDEVRASLPRNWRPPPAQRSVGAS